MTGVACPKPEPRLRVKARADRHAGSVLRQTHTHCFARELEGCAVQTRLFIADAEELIARFGPCAGPLQLMHLFGNRRSQTRGLPPEQRHDPRKCLIGCEAHHEAEEHKGLRFVGMDSELGMTSPLIGWWVAPKKVTP